MTPRRLLLVVTLLLVACGREAVPSPQGDPAPMARVTVTGTGLFRVEPGTLARLGWRADSPLTLARDGEPHPFEVRDDALLFYLPEGTPGRYSPQQVLWLTYGDGSNAAVPVEAGNSAPLDQLVAEQRLTSNEQYSSSYVGDPWFWRTLVAPASETHEMATPGRLAGPVEVVIRVGGVTKVDHHLTVTVNEQEAGTLSWNGQKRFEDTFSVALTAGDALALTFRVPESEGGVDMSMLDEIVVRYPSQPRLTDGTFRGRTGEGGVATFEGASADAVAWQSTPSVAPLRVEHEGRAARVHLPATAEVVVSTVAQAQPAALERVDETALPTEGAAYVAIVAPELADAVEPLLDFHREEGLSVLALAPQQVYDAYSHGTTDPLAFRALLADAQESWATKPRFLLLVGDSTYDPQGYQSELPPAYLPSPFIETVFGGETVSDNVIADLDDDGYPDVAVGRLPARTATQVETMVRKIVDYSQRPPDGDWRERVLFAADGREALFRNTSERLREGLTEPVTTVTAYPDAASVSAMDELLPALNEGSLIVNYVGHGSVQQWGRDQLLTADVAGGLQNGERLPIFINMTCLTGLFSHPSQESLAETLLWAREGGAIAAVAPSSLTLPTNQSPLNEALLAELLAPERPTLGEALVRAKQGIPLTNDNEHDIVATFNLLGDPALRPAPRQATAASDEP